MVFSLQEVEEVKAREILALGVEEGDPIRIYFHDDRGSKEGKFVRTFVDDWGDEIMELEIDPKTIPCDPEDEWAPPTPLIVKQLLVDVRSIGTEVSLT